VALVLNRRTRRLFPFIERIYGDGGYQGPKAAKAAAKTGYWTIEIVERLSTAVGFEVLPKRWIVERTFAWLSRFRRLARDFERYARTVAAFIHLASPLLIGARGCPNRLGQAVRQAYQEDKPASGADETTSEAMNSGIINKLRDVIWTW